MVRSLISNQVLFTPLMNSYRLNDLWWPGEWIGMCRQVLSQGRSMYECPGCRRCPFTSCQKSNIFHDFALVYRVRLPLVGDPSL